MENKNCLVESPFAFENEQESIIEQEATILRNLLPNEIWQLVATRLEDDPVDFTSLTNSSPYFRNLLSSKQAQFLSNKVLNILIPTVWKNYGEDGLSFSDVLQCRGVSRLWSNAVDRTLDFVFSAEILPHKLNILWRSKSISEFDSTNDKLSKFLQHFEGTHGDLRGFGRNPFIGNTLTVIFRNDEEQLTDLNKRFLKNVSSVLLEHGQHINHFEFRLSGGRLFVANVLELTEWLENLENVESLSIIDETDDLELNNTEDFQAALESHYFYQEFPTLNNLVAMKIGNPSTHIFNNLIQHNNHISALELFDCWYEDIFFKISLPNLVVLEFEFGSEDFLQKFVSSSNFEWPMLETLHLKFNFNFNFELPAILQVIRTKFDCSKLKTLNLDIPKAKTDKAAKKLFRDSKRCRLELPNLVELGLTLGDPTSLDFLLPMKDTLESISFYITYLLNPRVKRVFSNTIVKFYGFEDNILDSNIPSIFTKLRLIEFVSLYNGNKLYNL